MSARMELPDGRQKLWELQDAAQQPGHRPSAPKQPPGKAAHWAANDPQQESGDHSVRHSDQQKPNEESVTVRRLRNPAFQN